MLMVKLLVFTDRRGQSGSHGRAEVGLVRLSLHTGGGQSGRDLTSKHFCPEAQRPTGWREREKQVVRRQVEYWTLLYKPVISYCTVHCTLHCTDSPLTQTDRHYYAAPAFINLKFNFSHDWRFDRKTHGFVIVR